MSLDCDKQTRGVIEMKQAAITTEVRIATAAHDTMINGMTDRSCELTTLSSSDSSKPAKMITHSERKIEQSKLVVTVRVVCAVAIDTLV